MPYITNQYPINYNQYFNDSEDESGSSAINIEKMSAAIANMLASSRQHTIPIFSGGKNEDPIKFMRVFERVAKALKWDDRTKCDKFPAYLSGAGEHFDSMSIQPQQFSPRQFSHVNSAPAIQLQDNSAPDNSALRQFIPLQFSLKKIDFQL